MDDLTITSAANPRLKALVGLRRRRTRDESSSTLVDGYDELRLALDAGVVPDALYWCPELMADASAQTGLVDELRNRGVETVRLGRQAFEKVAYREGPDGFLAVAPAPARGLDDVVLGADPLVLVCQGVEKPGNLGAMLRTADGAGVDAVVAADPVTDWGNPNLIRSSKGTVFSVPVVAADTPGALAWLDRHGIALVATTPDTDVLHTDVDYTGPIAIAVGAEKTGLTADVLDAATHRVRIPMVGRADSLNVATSAALVVYEAVRQRSRR